MYLSLKNIRLGVRGITPAIALVSAAFWIAWIELVYSGDIYIGDAQPTAWSIMISYIESTTAMAVMLIVFGFMSKRVHPLFQKGWWVVGAGLLASIATAGSLLTQSDVFVILTGVFTAVLAMRFNILFAQVNPKEIMLADTAALILASFIYGYVLSLPVAWRPLFSCLLPLLGGVCSMLDGGELRYDNQIEPMRASSDFIRLVIAIGIFSIAINVVRGFYPAMIEMNTFAEARGASSVLFFFVKVAIFTLILLLPLKTNLPKLCYYVFLLLAFATLPLPMFGLASDGILEVFGCINALLNLVVWTLLGSIAYKTGRSAIQLFGWGWGGMALGSVVGWMVGMRMYVAGVDSSMLAFVEIALIAVMLVSCMLVVNMELIDRLFTPVDTSDEDDRTIGDARDYTRAPALGGASDADGADAGARADEPAGAPETDVEGDVAVGQAGGDNTVSDDTGQNRGRWHRAVIQMADDYGLSSRETDVLELLLKGYTKNRTSDELCVSYNTVRSHVRNIYVKCDVHSQQELIDLFEQYHPNHAREGERQTEAHT
jgi:DNA-binding CsgD family transcriptional regulator